MSAQDQQQALASAVVELLAASPLAVARLRQLIEAPPAADSGTPAVFTVASLAATLQVSPRVVRGTIARGELDATKRGGRWIISAAAVDRRGAVEPRPAPPRTRRRLATNSGPLAAVMTVLDTGANRGDSRR